MVLCAFGFLSPHLALADFEAVSRAEAYDIITTGQTLQSGVYPQRENTYHAKETHQSFEVISVRKRSSQEKALQPLTAPTRW